MFTKFTAENFRGFRHTTVEPLERVNLIAGVNGAGKTAMLEALFLHVGPGNPELAIRVNSFRGIEPFTPDASQMWPILFHGMKIRPIKLSSVDDQGVERTLTIRMAESSMIGLDVRGKGMEEAIGPGPAGSLTTAAGPGALALDYRDSLDQRAVSGVFASAEGLRVERADLRLPTGVFLSSHRRLGTADVERYSDLERKGRQREVLAVLRVLEPRLKRLAVVATGGISMIYGDAGIGELVPLPLLGEGLGRVLGLLLAIGSARDGWVFVDEIENGVHHSAMPDVWKAVETAARRSNTQVFATTHSRECILAAHRTFMKTRRYGFRLHRLELVKGSIRATTYDEEALDGAIESGFEMR